MPWRCDRPPGVTNAPIATNEKTQPNARTGAADLDASAQSGFDEGVDEFSTAEGDRNDVLEEPAPSDRDLFRGSRPAGGAERGRADCPLMDWLFGNGRTTYAPPYTPPTVYAPAAPSCGLRCASLRPHAAVPPACQTCTPTTTYRISYRPVPTVTYMPVVTVDPCSGCAVTTYRPTQAWTYQASLVPSVTYRAGYAPVAAGVGCGGCARAAVIRPPTADVRRARRHAAAVPHAA